MVNRVADKESAKSILKHNGNQAAMIGMEILYTIISTFRSARGSNGNRNRDAQGTVRSCAVSLLFVSA